MSKSTLFTALSDESFELYTEEKIEIKKLKGFKGRGGMPLMQGELYLDGKKVAFLSEDYSGGCFNIEPFDRKDMVGINNFIKDNDYSEDNYFTELLYMFDFIRLTQKNKKTVVFRTSLLEEIIHPIPYRKELEPQLKERYPLDTDIVINRYLY